MQKSDQV